MKLTAIDLFCGAGGFSTGLMQAGIEVSTSVDKWFEACLVYQANHPNHCTLNADVNEINKRKCDILVGGAPCQDFTPCGKKVEGARADLTVKFAEIIIESNPRMAVMENVQQVQDSLAYLTAGNLFYDAGYKYWTYVFETEWWGVPQIRRRALTFVAKDLDITLLAECLFKYKEKKLMTLRRFLKEQKEDWGFEHFYRHPMRYSVRSIFSIDEPAPTICGSYSGEKKVCKGYKGNPADSIDYTTPGLRGLNAYERARIQTFPKDYVWDITTLDGKHLGRRDKSQMIGNAVPPELARRVGLAIIDYFNTIK